jgi:hypothetical protein
VENPFFRIPDSGFRIPDSGFRIPEENPGVLLGRTAEFLPVLQQKNTTPSPENPGAPYPAKDKEQKFSCVYTYIKKIFLSIIQCFNKTLNNR